MESDGPPVDMGRTTRRDGGWDIFRSTASYMPNFAAKYSSEYVTDEQMASALRALPDVLLELFGECLFIAYYGWASNIHSDLQHKPMRVPTGVMQWFITDSLDQGILVPGESDLILKSPEGELVLTFCHESDIHIDGDSQERMMQFMHAAPFREIQWLSQEELKAEHPDRQ